MSIVRSVLCQCSIICASVTVTGLHLFILIEPDCSVCASDTLFSLAALVADNNPAKESPHLLGTYHPPPCSSRIERKHEIGLVY